jgi:hypothetical protein
MNHQREKIIKEKEKKNGYSDWITGNNEEQDWSLYMGGKNL